MRQIKSFSLAKQQTEFLKTFCTINELKESEVMQWLIDKLSIDKKMQEYCFNKITAKRSAIEKQMATSDNVQNVKQKDASKPIPRDISAKDNIEHSKIVNKLYSDWKAGNECKANMEEAWIQWQAAYPTNAQIWARERGLL